MASLSDCEIAESHGHTGVSGFRPANICGTFDQRTPSPPWTAGPAVNNSHADEKLRLRKARGLAKGTQRM